MGCVGDCRMFGAPGVENDSKTTSDGFQSSSDGLQPTSDGLQPNTSSSHHFSITTLCGLLSAALHSYQIGINSSHCAYARVHLNDKVTKANKMRGYVGHVKRRTGTHRAQHVEQR